MDCVEMTEGVVTNVVVCDDPEFIQSMGWVDVDALTPRPEIGWTTSDGGQTFDAPESPAPPPPAPTLVADPTTIPADGITASTVTLKWPADENATPAPANVVLSINGALQSVPLVNGQAQVAVTSTYAGTTITVSCSGATTTVTVT